MPPSEEKKAGADSVKEKLWQTEKMLRRLQSIIEGSDDAIYSYDLSGTIESWNKGAEKTYGYMASEMIGKNTSVIIPEYLQDETAVIMERIRQGESVDQYETTRRKKDGTLIEVYLTISPISDEGGKIFGASTIARDVTDRKKAEDALRDSEERFRQFADNSPDVMWLSAEGDFEKIVYVSPIFRKIWGVSEIELYNSPGLWIQKIHPDDSEKMAKRFEEFTKGENKDYDIEYRLMQADGSVRWIHDHGFKVRSWKGNVLRVGGIAEDITERKKAEEALRELNNRKSAFVSHVSHEFKNPLFVIKDASQLILSEATGSVDPKQKHMIEIIHNSAGRMLRLVMDLLDISKIEAGKMELRRELIELEPMMREVIAGQEIDVAKKKLVLTKNIQAGIGTMWGDKDKLTEVLINLLSNAVKYTPAGGKISVVLSGTKDAVRLEVADTGKGIAGEDLTKIFDKFERVTAEKEEGTGLGLAITKDIVELHKGKVWAESEPGKGSSFIVTLPRDLRQKAIE